MVPLETTIAVVEDELAALSAFAERRGWRVTWQEQSLKILAEGPHPADQSAVRIQADVTDYRSVPPAWTFLGLPLQSVEPPKPAPFPKADTLPGGVGSIFHPNRLICAPFNRLAYSQHNGPHDNWGGPTGWMKVTGHARADKLADMLAVILAHLRYSPGWHE
jgi:hypothetical protein